MAKNSFKCPNCGGIIYASGEHKQPKPRFRSMQSTANINDYETGNVEYLQQSPNFWDSYSIRYVVAGFACAVPLAWINWFYGLAAGWAVALSIVLIPVSLHVLNIWKMSPPKPTAPRDSIVKIEATHPNDITGTMTELSDIDNRITIDDIKAVAKMITNDRGWSRASIMVHCHCTDYKARIITSEMNRVGVIEKSGGKYRVTESGKSLANNF